MGNLTILIPAAGKSGRFRAAGIDRPKGLISFRHRKDELTGVKGAAPRRTMIEHIVGNLQTTMDAEVLVLCQRAQELAFKETLRAYEVRPIGFTRGQADTILQGLAFVQDGPVLVINSDQAFGNGVLHWLVGQAKAAATQTASLVFDGEGKNSFSYIASPTAHTTTHGLLFKEAYEKIPVSKWALAGAYVFRDARTLADKIARAMTRMGDVEEPYLSDCFSEFISNLAVPMKNEELYGWGTPEQLMADKGIWDLDPDVEELLRRFK